LDAIQVDAGERRQLRPGEGRAVLDEVDGVPPAEGGRDRRGDDLGPAHRGTRRLMVDGNSHGRLQLARPRSPTWNADKYCSAVRCQENSRARASPRSANSARNPRSVKTSYSLSARATSSRGSNCTPASPTTSGKELAFDDTTGTPQAIASSGGNPNPSY